MRVFPKTVRHRKSRDVYDILYHDAILNCGEPLPDHTPLDLYQDGMGKALCLPAMAITGHEPLCEDLGFSAPVVLECNIPAKDGDVLVVYQDTDSRRRYARPIDEFTEDRFEVIE